MSENSTEEPVAAGDVAPDDAVAAHAGDDDWEDQAVYGPSTVIAALDQMEDLVNEARAVPLSATVMVNRAELLDLLDQAREALPEDLVAADAVVADADAVLGRADSAAEVTIAEANQRARTTLDEARDKANQIVTEAREQAQRLTERATQEAESTRAQARADAESTLADAAAQAERLVSTHNISQLAEDRARQLVAEARAKGESLTRGADEYAAKSLGEVAHLLNDLQRRTDAGRRAISERSGLDRTDIDLDSH